MTSYPRVKRSAWRAQTAESIGPGKKLEVRRVIGRETERIARARGPRDLAY
jgi:hypothetical protein